MSSAQYAFLPASTALLPDRDLTIMNVFCVSCVCVGCKVEEAYELWHADCNNDGKDSGERESHKKKKNEISIHSAAAVSHLCLHAIYAV